MVRTVASVGCAALALVASASASTQRDALIRPGVGIGKVRLGMTLAQVRAAWGRPQAQTVETLPRGGRRIELQYDFAAYTVTLTGRPSHETVATIATTLSKEKTRQGLGVGTPERRLQRLLRGELRCDRLDVVTQPRSPYPLLSSNRRECTLGAPGSPQTVFVSRMRRHSFLPEDWSASAYVFEVVIRAPGVAD
jgi:hypothetical protein